MVNDWGSFGSPLKPMTPFNQFNTQQDDVIHVHGNGYNFRVDSADSNGVMTTCGLFVEWKEIDRNFTYVGRKFFEMKIDELVKL